MGAVSATVVAAASVTTTTPEDWSAVGRLVATLEKAEEWWRKAYWFSITSTRTKTAVIKPFTSEGSPEHQVNSTAGENPLVAVCISADCEVIDSAAETTSGPARGGAIIATATAPIRIPAETHGLVVDNGAVASIVGEITSRNAVNAERRPVGALAFTVSSL